MQIEEERRGQHKQKEKQGCYGADQKQRYHYYYYYYRLSASLQPIIIYRLSASLQPTRRQASFRPLIKTQGTRVVG